MLLAVITICAVMFSVNDAAPGNVGFSAVVSDDRKYTTNDIVKFDKAFLNLGNVYSSNNGIFTAPKTGLYVFHVHGRSNSTDCFGFTIHRNDESLYRAYGLDKQAYSSGGNSIALKVNYGESVSVKAHTPSSIHGSGLNRYTTFTGYLVDVGTKNFGFSAVVSDNRDYKTNEIVKFDKVYVNNGNAYNSDTGIFTSPKTGLYVFHVHGLSRPNTGFWFTIYRNDESLYRAHGRVEQGYSYGGNSIALIVQSGDRVSVKAHEPSSIHGTGVARYTTFTGYLVDVATGNVGFSAVVSDDRKYQTNTIVKFDNVYVNYGEAYNKDTGIFTAPKTGQYVFHVHGLALPNTGFWFTIYRNDESLYRANGQVSQGHSSGGNSIALSVKSGERVYVKVHYPSTIHGNGLNRYTTFTGYLVDVGNK